MRTIQLFKQATAPPALLWFVAGFVVWSIAFVALYAVQALGCEWGWHLRDVGPVSQQHLVLGAIFAGHVAVIALLSLIAWRWWSGNGNGARGFIRIAAVALSVSALVATIWTGLPAVVLSACVG